MNLTNALTFLVSGGSIAVVSWIADQIPAFVSLASKVKMWLFFVISALLSVGSYAVLHYVPTAILAELAPYFIIVAGIFTTIFVGNSVHAVTTLNKSIPTSTPTNVPPK